MDTKFPFVLDGPGYTNTELSLLLLYRTIIRKSKCHRLDQSIYRQCRKSASNTIVFVVKYSNITGSGTVYIISSAIIQKSK